MNRSTASLATEPGRLIKHPCDVMPRDAEIDRQIDVFLAEIIGDGRYLDSATVGQSITNKIH